MPSFKNRLSRLCEGVRTYRVSYLMMLPYLIFFVLFTILPVIVSIVLSFTDYDMVQTPVFVGLENYFQIFLNVSQKEMIWKRHMKWRQMRWALQLQVVKPNICQFHKRLSRKILIFKMAY